MNRTTKLSCLAAAALLILAGCQSKQSQGSTSSATPAPSSTTQATPAAQHGAKPLSSQAAKGKQIAEKCAACHNFDTTPKVGPGLGGIFGRKAGSVAGYQYEFATYIQPGKAWHWDAAHLAAWICSSDQAVIAFTGDGSARTRMPSQHVCDPTEQSDLIEYLKTL